MSDPEIGVTYEDSGVSIARGDEIVQRIAAFVPGIGDFGGRFPLDVAGMARPILVAGADGVGTKIRVHIAADRHEAAGVDLVAMNVNDVICSGARPLFFLDYVAASRLDPDTITRAVKGMAAACKESGCVLLGGETAELPGFYAPGDYDLAGFAVGLADESRLLGPHRVLAGDALLGLPSSGLHSNGFSLARAILGDDPQGEVEGRSLKDAVSEPTRLYVKPVLDVLNACDLHACAHITGGGIPGNLPRAIPAGLRPAVDWASWERPALFRLLQERGKVPENDMRDTFNCGIGMILVLPESSISSATRALAAHNIVPIRIGSVVADSTPGTAS